MARQEQFAKGYRMLAELGYRPAAPSDGFGNVTVAEAEMDLEREARAYAEAFAAEDDAMVWDAGCTHWEFAPCAVLALEAFRLMNAGHIWSHGRPADRELVPNLLRRAAKEYERVVRAEAAGGAR
jgi:hypothetical protein